MQEINQKDFAMWKLENITQYIFEQIRNSISNIEQEMVCKNTIMALNGQLELARLQGIREGLHTLLEWSIDDFREENND